jgi:hypothetical protein
MGKHDMVCSHHGEHRSKDCYTCESVALINALRADNSKLRGAVEMFQNRRKLAHSLRAESPHVAAFVEAIGVEIDKILRPDSPGTNTSGDRA